MFMGAFESLPTGAKGWHRVSKGFGYASIVYGTLLLVGVATGTGSLFQPIQGLTVANSEVSAQQQHATFQRVKSVEQLKVALSDAQANNKPVMLASTPTGASAVKRWRNLPSPIRKSQRR